MIYLARDEDGSLWCYLDKPQRGESEFMIGDMSFELDKADYPEVTWENSPVPVIIGGRDRHIVQRIEVDRVSLNDLMRLDCFSSFTSSGCKDFSSFYIILRMDKVKNQSRLYAVEGDWLVQYEDGMWDIQRKGEQ